MKRNDHDIDSLLITAMILALRAYRQTYDISHTLVGNKKIL